MQHIHKPLSLTALLLSALGGFTTQAWFGENGSGKLWGQEVASLKTPPVSQPTEFLRMTLKPAASTTKSATDSQQAQETPLALETAVVSYHANQADSSASSGDRKTSDSPLGEGITVDLIGAVHIGEASYYAQLNRLFDHYDVLLYELVAPEGTVVPLGGKRETSGFNPVGMLQDSAKNMLGLESQLERIDYTKRHFVRADMTPTQIADKMAERGDTAVTLALSTLTEVLRQQNVASQKKVAAAAPRSTLEDIGLTDMLGNPLKMKQVLAAQFAQTGSLDQALGGPLNQLLVVDRNAAALKILQKQIAAGKKRIGIFYGAAHLPDFEQHLIEDFGLVRGSKQWLVAWDLTTATEPKLSQPAALLLNLLKGLE